MTRINATPPPAINATTGQPTPPDQAGQGLEDVNIDQFLELLLAEMQNQDPMNPMDNAQMIEQIGQIREISATSSLTDTLSMLASNQQLVTASGLIGREITGLSDAGDISGIVDRVTVEIDENDQNSRTVKVHVGERTIDIDNIRQINQQSDG
jgi:flagellar basal-body rod modification protein FlgD